MLEKSLVALSDMVINHPEIMELDINPLLVYPEGQGVMVADCRMILRNDGGFRPDNDV
jgi:acetyltransferase